MEIVIENQKQVKKLCECGPGFYQRIDNKIIFNVFKLGTALYYQCIHSDGSFSTVVVPVGCHADAIVVPLTPKKMVFE